jgi:hypothetical protein
VKRAAAALVTLGMAAATCTPAFALNPAAAVKMTWTVAATAQLSIATQYTTGSATLTQNLGTPSLLPSVAGACAGSGSEVADNLTYGSITPSASVEVGCDYQNAVAAEVVTNDSNGYFLNEFLAAAPPAGTTFCAVPNGSTTGTATTTTVSSLSGNPAAATNVTTCAVGTALVAGTAPVAGSVGQNTPVTGLLGTPGVATPGIETATAPGAGNFAWGTSAAATPGTGSFFSEDMQINFAANQASANNQSAFLIIQLIPR